MALFKAHESAAQPCSNFIVFGLLEVSLWSPYVKFLDQRNEKSVPLLMLKEGNIYSFESF